MRAAGLGRSRAVVLAAGLAAALAVLGSAAGLVQPTAASWTRSEQSVSPAFTAQAPGTPVLSCTSSTTTPAVVSWPTPTTALAITYSEYRWSLTSNATGIVSNSGTVLASAGPPYSVNTAGFNPSLLNLNAQYTMQVTAYSGAWSGTPATVGLKVSNLLGVGGFTCS